jgi:hypothetical protein
VVIDSTSLTLDEVLVRIEGIVGARLKTKPGIPYPEATPQS